MSDVRDRVEAYIAGVLDGSIVAGRLARLAVRRHVLDREIGPRRGLRFDERRAEGWCEFFPKCCVHSTGEYAGEPFELREFQAFFIWVLFGWLRSDGTRRFRDALISFARGNGKSPIAAGIGLGCAFMDWPREARAEVYCAATKKDQAKIVWEEAARMVEAGPLREIVTVMRGNMHAVDNGSKFEPLGSDSDVTDGLVPHAVIRDELHAWKATHRGLYEKIQTALGKRRQALGLTITTAGDERADIWKEQYLYSCRVVEQVLNPPGRWFGDEHFSFICEVDKEDDIYDERNWPKANPMLREPRSPVKIEHIQTLVEKARRGDIATENMVRRYHFNQMVASTDKAFTPESWSLGNQEIGPVDGYMAFGGLDLARSNDFAAATICWPLEDGEYGFRTWVWTCRKRRDELNSAEFLALLEQENIEIHDGNQIEFSAIREKLVELHHEYGVKSWGFDDSFARETGQWLKEEQGIEVVAIPQTCRSYNEPIRKFTDLLLAGKVRHGGDRALAWQANNLILRSNAASLLMPDKEASPYKIDSMVALFMAFSECLFAERNQQWSEEEIGI